MTSSRYIPFLARSSFHTSSSAPPLNSISATYSDKHEYQYHNNCIRMVRKICLPTYE